MTQPVNKRSTGHLLVLLLVWPMWGHAQAVQPGDNGIKVGEGRLHLTFDLESRYDSAIGYFAAAGQAPDVGNLSLSGDLLMRARPGVRYELPSPRLALFVTSYLDYLFYTGLLTPASRTASRFQGLVDASLSLNRQGAVGLELREHYSYSDRSANIALGNGFLAHLNELSVGVPLRPGGGALELTPEVAWSLEDFTPFGLLLPPGCQDPVCGQSAVDNADYHNLRAGLRGRWRLLPKTALLLDTRFDYRFYPRGTNPEALLLRASAGAAGLLTSKLSVTLKVGWSQNFGPTGQGTVTGQGELGYQFSQTLFVKGGYLRSLEPVSVYGTVRNDRLYVEARSLLGGRLTLHGSVLHDWLSFSGTTAGRDDRALVVDVGPDYLVQRWLQVGLSYLLTNRSSSVAGAGLNFTRHEVYLRVTGSY